MSSYEPRVVVAGGGVGALETVLALRAIARDRVRAEDAGPVAYEHLVLATGAVQQPAVPGALTFRGPEDVHRFREALGVLEERDGGSVVFVTRSATDWTLPLYELALLTSTWAAKRELSL